jgi:hypothetical protein
MAKVENRPDVASLRGAPVRSFTHNELRSLRALDGPSAALISAAICCAAPEARI